MKKLIIFVCNGNIHRSVVAEQCLKQLLKDKSIDNEFKVISRGIQGVAKSQSPKHKNITEYDHWKITRPIIEKLGMNSADFSKHKSKQSMKK